MSNKKNNPVNKPPQKKFDKKSKNQPKTNPFLKVFIVNIILLAAGLVILNYYLRRPEIGWINEMLTNNYKAIKKNPDASFDERLEMKLGYNYTYLKFVKDNTPDTAVILFPPREIILKQPTNFQDANGAMNYSWIYSMVYPRKVVIDGTETSLEVTHIAIMNGWGYDKINYKISEYAENTVLPIIYNPN